MSDIYCSLYFMSLGNTKLLPSARLAWCCPLIQSRWPMARWGSKRSLRSLLCVRRGWTKEKQSRGITNAHYYQLNTHKKEVNSYCFCPNWPAAQEDRPQHPLVTAPLRSCWGPRRWASCQCRWRPRWFRCEVTTEPVREGNGPGVTSLSQCAS